MRKCLLVVALTAAVVASAQGLKDVVGHDCLIGVALNEWQCAGQDSATTAVVRRHFNCAVAENCMKSGPLQPQEGVFRFEQADSFVDYCEANGLTATGHCLVWHSQAPAWLFSDGKGGLPSREVLAERLRRHITTVVRHFKGRLRGWDVVNEAIEDDGTFRRSPLYQVLGEDFIDIAFAAAHEADPDVELYYNDYSMAVPAKRDAVCRMVRRLKERGIRIDAVGMQSHVGLDYPDLAAYEAAIDSFAAYGVKVMVTELDVNVLPNPWGFSGADIAQSYELQQRLNPYADGLPDSVQRQLTQRYADLFAIYRRHRHQLSRISLWGVADHHSWLNGWPVEGRTNYPLLFDRNYQPKPAVERIMREWNMAPAASVSGGARLGHGEE